MRRMRIIEGDITNLNVKAIVEIARGGMNADTVGYAEVVQPAGQEMQVAERAKAVLAAKPVGWGVIDNAFFKILGRGRQW